MSKNKTEIAVLPTGDLHQTVITSIKAIKQEHVNSGVIPVWAGGIIALIGAVMGITTGDVLEALMALPFSGVMLSIGGALMIFDKAEKLDRTFFPSGGKDVSMLFDMFKVRKERLLINTIHVKEKVDVDIDAWQNPKNAVPEHEATHTIKQYLRKTKQGFQVEQEISPNHETIWDISANALVEVYGVQEKTESEKEINA